MAKRLLLLCCCLPSVLPAQVVRGVVRDSVSGQPASGVLVALVQGASGSRRTVLTDEAGRFTIGAPGAGTYVLEIKRIGVRPTTTTPFTLLEGEARELVTTVAPVVARLDAVRVSGRSYCGERVRQGVETATLWEEVRAALLAAQISRQNRAVLVTITSFTRTLDPRTFEVRDEERSERTGVTANPFESAPIASLSAHGYVVPDGEHLQYRGPDVDVLLSDEFVREHCFRAVLGGRDRDGLVGLSFEPTSARRVPDIAGVLWIDGRTRELKRLEYKYVGGPVQPQEPFPLSYMEFARMPAGSWIVQRWAIRMPQITRPVRETPKNPLVVADAPRERLVAVIETGGEAFVGVRQSSRQTYAVEGTAFDSTTGRPLAGARVFFRGTAFTTTSDQNGQFRIQLPDTGAYMLAIEHPRLDTLNFDPPARTVRPSGNLTMANIAVPPLPAVRSALCGAASATLGRAIVHGTLRGSGGAPMAWATIRYRWDQFAVAGSTSGSPVSAGATVPMTASAPGATFVADSRGRYLICDVPGGRYRLTVESERGEIAETEILVDGGQMVMRNLTLRPR